MTTTQLIQNYRTLRQEFDDKITYVSRGLEDGDYDTVAELYEKNVEYHQAATYKYNIPPETLTSVIIYTEDEQINILDIIRNIETLDERSRDLFNRLRINTATNIYADSLAEINILRNRLQNQYNKLQTFNSADWS